MAGKKVPRSTTYQVEIANRIWLTRLAMGLSPTQMAERLDVNLNTYSQWESIKNPSLPELINYADRLQISLDWVIRGHEESLPQGLYKKIKTLEEEYKDVTAARLASRRAGRPKKHDQTDGWDTA